MARRSIPDKRFGRKIRNLVLVIILGVVTFEVFTMVGFLNLVIIIIIGVVTFAVFFVAGLVVGFLLGPDR